MAIMTVTHTDQSTKGKARVYFGNKHNWQDAYYVGKCATPSIGQVIDATVSSKDFNNDGKLTWFLNSWSAAKAAEPAPVAPKAANSGWDIPTGDLSRFVSNVVGSAIAAGIIKQPSDIAPWIASAYRSCQGLRTGKILDFDDDPREVFVVPDEEEDPNDEIPF